MKEKNDIGFKTYIHRYNSINTSQGGRNRNNIILGETLNIFQEVLGM